MSGASSGVYMYVFCVYKMAFEFKMDLISSDIIFLMYSLLASVFFGCVCGVISLTASYTFVRTIYGLIKID